MISFYDIPVNQTNHFPSSIIFLSPPTFIRPACIVSWSLSLFFKLLEDTRVWKYTHNKKENFYLHHHELKRDLDSDHGSGKSRKMCDKTRIDFVANLFITRRVIMPVFVSLIHMVVIRTWSEKKSKKWEVSYMLAHFCTAYEKRSHCMCCSMLCMEIKFIPKKLNALLAKRDFLFWYPWYN